MVKIAHLNAEGAIDLQEFVPRDYEAGIALQVDRLLSGCGIDSDSPEVRVCSSANGGLRVGIVCLSKTYSGEAFRNQVLLAGANPVFVHEFEEASGDLRRVDILLVGGGIDCSDAAPFAGRLARFDPAPYRFGTLMYAGNKALAEDFQRRFQGATVIDNPLGTSLSSRLGSVFQAVRRAYLEDLIYKEGVSELGKKLAHGIGPTPEVASRGFLRAVLNKSGFQVVGSCIALDIGGATTDLHYTVEIVREDSEAIPASGLSVARYVFTDLGVFASRDTLLLQLRAHPRLYEFLDVVLDSQLQETYGRLREGELSPPPAVMAYACMFIALDRFAHGAGPGLPVASLDRVAQIILTGGAAQALDVQVAQRVVGLLVPANLGMPLLQVDRRYQLWVDGISWVSGAPD